MNDPHVVALIYNVDHGDSVIYDEAEPLFQEEKGVRLEVKDKKAWFYLKDHYATEADARKVIEEYIRNWEFNACLQGGPDYFKLKFERAQIEDRNPPPRTPGVVALAATASFGCLRVSASLTVTNKVSRYPSPPSDVTITPDVQKMYDRYMAHRRSREPLAGTAYFCLTLVEHLGNGRPAAAEYFQISRNVLDKIGELSTERGESYVLWVRENTKVSIGN